MSQTIKTAIKFQRGIAGKNLGKVYGFVTKDNGKWKGVRENDGRKKKIVFADDSIMADIVENTLYWCRLIPQGNTNCFTAITAESVKFEGKVDTICRDGMFLCIVRWGMKKVVYDAASSDKYRSDMAGIANYLRSRHDLRDNLQVAEDFLNAAFLVKNYYKRKKDVHR